LSAPPDPAIAEIRGGVLLLRERREGKKKAEGTGKEGEGRKGRGEAGKRRGCLFFIQLLATGLTD